MSWPEIYSGVEINNNKSIIILNITIVYYYYYTLINCNTFFFKHSRKRLGRLITIYAIFLQKTDY